jgi:hypothetical protein
VLELQHVPREGNSAVDALSAKASTQAPVPEGVFQRRLLKPSAQPAGLGEGGRTSVSKLAVQAVLHPWSPPRVVCTLEGPEDLEEPCPVSQEGPNVWISKVRDYVKDNFLPEDQASAERIVRMAKWYTVVEGISTVVASTASSCDASPGKRAATCSWRSMEASAEVILHPARWSVRPSGMAFTSRQRSRMQLSW